MAPYPATRAEISRSQLTQNFSRLRTLAHQTYGCDLLAVVKADAYGHGVSLCAPWLMEAGARWLGVTSVAEGAEVRKLCPGARILVMTGLLPGEAAGLLDARLVPTIWTMKHLDTLAEVAEQRALAPGSVPVHLELDTGMSRQGVSHQAAELAALLDALRAIPALHLEGVFTHFASAEILDADQNVQQMACFERAVRQIAAAGFHPQWLHTANSSTLLGGRHAGALAALAKTIGAKLLVRPGIALYGYTLPFSGTPVEELPIELEPVLAWKTVIGSMRTVEAGTQVGYNGTFIAAKQMRLALLPVGYADGIHRKLSNRGHVLVGGVAAPIVGRISMDLTIVDVSGVPEAQVGDEVVILGQQNAQRITADDHARWAETISYEILCAISARVPRVGSD